MTFEEYARHIDWSLTVGRRRTPDSVPAEVWERLPEDGSIQHDHYIYGTPKRS